MSFKQFYAILVAFCGGAVMFSGSTSGLILIVLSLIYWELVKNDN
jgi:hypothetical protein